jgi:hypothetical protein
MPVYIEAETDPFVQNMQEQLAQAEAWTPSVRRPVRGVEVHENTYSYMRILDSQGEPIPFLDTGGQDMPWLGPTPMSTSYSNYLLQALSFSSVEKVQVVPTFGDTYAFFFGDQPVQAQISGGLVHTPDFPWSEEMWENYRGMMRGTKLAEKGARLYLFYDGVLLEGYPIAYNPNQTADVPNFVPFGMTILVSGLEMLRPKDGWFPIRRSQQVDLTQPDAYQQLAAMSETERIKYADQFRSSQVTQLNQAAYSRERTWYKRARDLGVLWEAMMYNRLPPLSFQRFITVDDFMRHGSPSTFSVTPGDWARRRVLPIRGKIRDNWDEYLIGWRRDAVGPDSNLSQPTMTDGEAGDVLLDRGSGPDLSDQPGYDPSETWDMGDQAWEDLGPVQEDLGTTMGGPPGDVPGFGSSVTEGGLVP